LSSFDGPGTGILEPARGSKADSRPYIQIARDLAPKFAQRADLYDQRAEFPNENLDDLIRSGYTAMTVPQRHGGGGASLEELCLAQEILAAACASTAFAVNMHVHGVAMLNLLEDADLVWVYDSIVHDGGLIAGGFSEPGVGGNWWFPTTRVVPENGAYRMTGRKAFFTGYPRATLLFLTGVLEDADGVKQPVGFLIPRPDRGVRIVREWDALGMRATGSHTVAIEDLVVEEQYLLGKPGELGVMFMRAVHWAWCSFAAVFVGIARGALAYVTTTMAERKLAVMNKPLSHLPGVQFKVADMTIKLEAARAALYRGARRTAALAEDPIAHYVEMSLMKMSVCQLAYEVVCLGMQVVGGHSYLTLNPLQRMYRDVTAGLFLPPPADVALEWAGKLALGVPVLCDPRWGE
jgi:alkylation response protein AidB-like acyl-CoA dehydrogenase